jgi:hypothetical protein
VAPHRGIALREKRIGRPDLLTDLSENIHECGVDHPQDLIKGGVRRASFPDHAAAIEHTDERAAIIILADFDLAIRPDPAGNMWICICERSVSCHHNLRALGYTVNQWTSVPPSALIVLTIPRRRSTNFPLAFAALDLLRSTQ